MTENRQRPFEGMDLRALDNGTGGENLRFTGYASVTNTPYEMEDFLGPYTEVIRGGAFAASLAAGADVPFKVNHGGLTLARTRSGTMRLAEDSRGLHVEADLDPRNPDVQALRSAMERGDLDEMSFAFRVNAQEWSPDWSQRDITDVDLHKGDVSAVNFGANPATAGAVLRSHDVAAAFLALRDGQMPPETAQLLRTALAGAIPEVTEGADSADLSHFATRLRALNF
ncbi:HK97 family phage prohead protease [Streptomyces sp. SDr-06]|uniref:HK97 family phage prohead protease n=1 Tax=Streptomyces sp. SDr-06 TaxID=2267702 RepID=UPI00167A29B0|nr:HK97 family phage prohead protease [Streptomyces sp. SDr-06]